MSETKHFLKGRRILVLEDEGLIALDIESVLENWGCIVVGPAANVPAALHLVVDNRPDAAILDAHIDDGTSEPVAHALRLAQCPFVVLSAYQKTDLPDALKGVPLLRKPLDERQLEAELRQLFGGLPRVTL
jgi:CheY-like chemotaxis protein